MVGLITDNGGAVIAVHRTFLDQDGRKAAVDRVKMALGPVGGRAVNLGPPSDAIVVAEGIESALGASTAFGRPALAALSTSGLRGLRLRPSIADVIIALDWDTPDRTGVGPGLRAALSLKASIETAAALEGRNVRVSLRPPPMGRRDYADLG